MDGKPFRIAPGLAKRYTVCSDECKLARQQKPIPSEKRCAKCKQVKAIDQFYVQGGSKRPFARCKSCCADDQREQIAEKREADLRREPGGIPDRTPPGYRSTKRVKKTCTAYLPEKGARCGQTFQIATSIAHKYTTCCPEHSALGRFDPPPGDTKACTKCGREKSIDQFYKQKHRGGKPMAWCIECCNERDVADRLARPGAHVDAGRHYRRRKTLGLSKEEYAVLKLTLRMDCAICGWSGERGPDDLCLDHDHRTGFFRDMLCSDCNRAIGFLKDDPEVARKLLAYLILHRDKHVTANGKADIYPESEPPVAEGHRRCPRCRLPKPLEEFNGGYCDPCRNSYMKVYMRAKRAGMTVKEYEALHPEAAA